MESYNVSCYYKVGDAERRVRSNFVSLDDCRRFVSENRDIEVLSKGSVRRVPFVRYEIVRMSESVVESGDYGEVREA